MNGVNDDFDDAGVSNDDYGGECSGSGGGGRNDDDGGGGDCDGSCDGSGVVVVVLVLVIKQNADDINVDCHALNL